MVKKVLKTPVVHKRTKPFKRFQAHQFKRIQTTWRRPKGIDNPLRRHYRGRGPMPSIGFGTDKRTRYHDKNGFIRYVVNNSQELEVLLMHNHKYQAVIGQSVGARKRIKLLERARELDIKVVNARGKLKTEEQE
ncbi:ribosomal protein L32 [Acrasis kona]|uniref:Ribosomal protein L32 n=1 Tax=Acrasis kona TaxID=1008807 RepID=A0AAW2ZC81_9EUKA